jgi:branched-chain amino acid transport system ATP-binding protein
LLVAQNIHRGLHLAGRAYVLEGGQLVLEGPSAVLLRDPRIRSAYLGT